MTQINNNHVAAFFAGAGGLDLGFKQAGFKVIWANEFDKTIWPTYESNFPKTVLDRRSISEITPSQVPEVSGFIGGPPCQSWSEAGALRGLDDTRGQLFFEYLRLMEAKKPTFFLAENVSGILFDRHKGAFRSILHGFSDIGYNVSYGLVNASNYGVPQDRERVIIVGYKSELEKFFVMPQPDKRKVTLRDAIYDLRKSAKPVVQNDSLGTDLSPANHEYMLGGFSSMYMSRNRVRSWDEVSYTIQAGARHAPLHPDAPKMIKVRTDEFSFAAGHEHRYRRLSVREAARIQGFPDDFRFSYSRVSDGYKMIGNAVPVGLAKHIAKQIKRDLSGDNFSKGSRRRKGSVQSFSELSNDLLQI